MIFRDLIQPEEFYDGCEVYTNYPITKVCILTKFPETAYSLHLNEGYSTHSSFTNTGMMYQVYLYNNNRIYYKELICNRARRIIPTKYKPL